ncbi:hypothetical protein IJE86_01330 [bacterium]|nr:hypothetical protein [bacterium]
MEIVKNEKMNVNMLIAKEGYLLKDKNEVLEEGQEPYLTDKIYLASSITTIEQCEELWEEVKA